jgi:hypothetical protein
MTYLDYIYSIPRYQGGGSTPNPWAEFAKDITPGLGTYRAFQRAKEDPRFGTYLDAGLSAAGDAALLFGVGTAVKGVNAARKARNAYKSGQRAYDLIRSYAKTAPPLADHYYGRYMNRMGDFNNFIDDAHMYLDGAIEKGLVGSSANLVPGLNTVLRENYDE